MTATTWWEQYWKILQGVLSGKYIGRYICNIFLHQWCNDLQIYSVQNFQTLKSRGGTGGVWYSHGPHRPRSLHIGKEIQVIFSMISIEGRNKSWAPIPGKFLKGHCCNKVKNCFIETSWFFLRIFIIFLSLTSKSEIMAMTCPSVIWLGFSLLTSFVNMSLISSYSSKSFTFWVKLFFSFFVYSFLVPSLHWLGSFPFQPTLFGVLSCLFLTWSSR